MTFSVFVDTYFKVMNLLDEIEVSYSKINQRHRIKVFICISPEVYYGLSDERIQHAINYRIEVYLHE